MKERGFTVQEANSLLPRLRTVLGRIQELRKMVGERTDQLKILDVLWGKRVAEESNPDHQDFRSHREAIGGAVEEIEKLIRREILVLGVRFPQGGLEHGLLDFPTLLDGRWVYLCWKMDEEEIRSWHEVDGGFSGRKKLTPEIASRMGRGPSSDPSSPIG